MKEYRNLKVLEELYWKEGLSLNQIAKKFNTQKCTIWYWLKKFNIKRRCGGGTKKFIIDKNVLYELYGIKNLSLKKIAQIYNCSYTTILNRLKECKINRKPIGGLKIPKINKTLTEDKAYILGVLCGDGSVFKNSEKRNYGIELSTIDLEFALAFKKNLEKIYNLTTKIRTGSSTVTKIRGKNYKCKEIFRVKLQSKKVYEDIIKYNSNGFKTETWRVPKEITNSKDERVICSILKGFIDSEGTPREYCLEISSKNRKGLEDIKVLLSKIGIKRFYFYKDWKNVWKLIFSGKDNLLLFYRKVGFTIKRKQRILEKSVKYKWKSEGFKESNYWAALNLRIKGYSYGKISKSLGIDYEKVREWCGKRIIPYEIRRQIKLNNFPENWDLLCQYFTFLNNVKNNSRPRQTILKKV